MKAIDSLEGNLAGRVFEVTAMEESTRFCSQGRALPSALLCHSIFSLPAKLPCYRRTDQRA